MDSAPTDTENGTEGAKTAENALTDTKNGTVGALEGWKEKRILLGPIEKDGT